MLRRLALALLVLALLAGWQEALLHPLQHVDEHGHLVHVGDTGSDSHDHDSPDPSGRLCDALAALTACAPDAAQPVLVSEQFEHFLSSTSQGAPRVADAPPFLAQGPPVFL